MEESENVHFTEIIVASDMYASHFPTAYEAGFESVLLNTERE
jgi:hypothetical protein